jgi:hypothetical protein
MVWQVVATLTLMITMRTMTIMIILIRIRLHTHILYKICLLDCLFLVSIITLPLVFIEQNILTELTLSIIILNYPAGIVVFLLVEKLVRYVEENSSGSNTWGHHHHHHHAGSKKLKDEGDHNNLDQQSSSDAIVNSSEKVSGGSTDKSLRKVRTHFYVNISTCSR